MVWPTEFTPVVHEVNVKGMADGARDERLKEVLRLLVIYPRGQKAEATDDPPAMRVHRKHRAAKGKQQNATRDFWADSGQRPQKAFRRFIRHRCEWGQGDRTEFLLDSRDDSSQSSGLHLRHPCRPE